MLYTNLLCHIQPIPAELDRSVPPPANYLEQK